VGISGLKTAKKFQTDIDPQLNTAMSNMSDSARAMSYNVITESEEGLAAIDEFFGAMEDAGDTLAEAAESVNQTYTENMSKLSALVDTIKYYVLNPFLEALTEIAMELAAWFKTDEGKEWLGTCVHGLIAWRRI
jgi:trans-aconitate methyltransferase